MLQGEKERNSRLHAVVAQIVVSHIGRYSGYFLYYCTAHFHFKFLLCFAAYLLHLRCYTILCTILNE